MALALSLPIRFLPRPIPAPTTIGGQLAVLFAVALFARINTFGDPNYHVDETFYFFVGKAMHAGSGLYVDIWDRKPPGLFLLFWLLAGISGSVLSFQIAALLFATLTGLAVTRIALRWADPLAAVLSGCLYIAYLQPLLGGGAQAPVFYNLFIATGVLMLVHVIEKPAGCRTLRYAAGAAALAGLAVVVKPTAIFEGTFLVLAFVAVEWHRTRKLAAAARVLLVAGSLAALPVLSCLAWYTAKGELAVFWQATVTSNFQKEHAPAWLFDRTAMFLGLVMAPILSCAIFGWGAARREDADKRLLEMMSWWLIAALAGFIAVPNYYSHYALPLLPVLAVLSARYFTQRPLGPQLALFFIAWALFVGQSFDLSRGLRSKWQFDRAASVIRANLHDSGKLYVFDGPPYLYAATGARWTGRYVFPEHLSNGLERQALGLDATAELTRVLDARPDVVVVTTTPKPTMNRANFAVLKDRLVRGYHWVCDMPVFDFEHSYKMMVFARSAHPDRSSCKVA